MSNRTAGVLSVCGVVLALFVAIFLLQAKEEVKNQSATLDRVEPEVQAILEKLEAERAQQKKLLDQIDDAIAKVRACKQSVLAAAIRLNSNIGLTDEEFRKRMLELSDKIKQQSAEEAGMDGR